MMILAVVAGLFLEKRHNWEKIIARAEVKASPDRAAKPKMTETVVEKTAQMSVSKKLTVLDRSVNLEGGRPGLTGRRGAR